MLNTRYSPHMLFFCYFLRNILLFSIYRWENWVLKVTGNLLKVTQLAGAEFYLFFSLPLWWCPSAPPPPFFTLTPSAFQKGAVGLGKCPRWHQLQHRLLLIHSCGADTALTLVLGFWLNGALLSQMIQDTELSWHQWPLCFCQLGHMLWYVV